jgi:hypothetical protein
MSAHRLIAEPIEPTVDPIEPIVDPIEPIVDPVELAVNKPEPPREHSSQLLEEFPGLLIHAER